MPVEVDNKDSLFKLYEEENNLTRLTESLYLFPFVPGVPGSVIFAEKSFLFHNFNQGLSLLQSFFGYRGFTLRDSTCQSQIYCLCQENPGL
jgi:hypothetical protein